MGRSDLCWQFEKWRHGVDLCGFEQRWARCHPDCHPRGSTANCPYSYITKVGRVRAIGRALTRTSQKSDELLAHGAAEVLAVEEVDVVQRVKELTDGKGAELVFDAVGGSGFAKLAEATATGGT